MLREYSFFSEIAPRTLQQVSLCWGRQREPRPGKWPGSHYCIKGTGRDHAASGGGSPHLDCSTLSHRATQSVSFPFGGSCHSQFQQLSSTARFWQEESWEWDLFPLLPIPLLFDNCDSVVGNAICNYCYGWLLSVWILLDKVVFQQLHKTPQLLEVKLISMFKNLPKKWHLFVALILVLWELRSL